MSAVDRSSEEGFLQPSRLHDWLILFPTKCLINVDDCATLNS